MHTLASMLSGTVNDQSETDILKPRYFTCKPNYVCWSDYMHTHALSLSLSLSLSSLSSVSLSLCSYSGAAKLEDAADLYVRAANSYKVAKKWIGIYNVRCTCSLDRRPPIYSCQCFIYSCTVNHVTVNNSVHYVCVCVLVGT